MSRAKSDFVDWASCLHPFGEDPYGPALPHDPVCAAIREARREDDPGLPQGVWERELKRADWDKALSLSLGVLRERSKDMQVAGWACEAALMRYGFASLPGGLRMIAGLCSGFGDGLHPQPEGSDQEARLARLAWLDSTLAERAASLPITEASPDVPAATYADWMAMEHRERIQNGNGKNGVAGDARRMLNLAGTQTSPAFHASLHGQLREALLVLAWHPSAGTDPLVSPPSSPASLSSPPPPPSFSSREQAYASLSAIADYLMRTEPHSPAPWLVKRAVSWGGMTLAELLDELLGQGENLASIKKLLGMTKE